MSDTVWNLVSDSLPDEGVIVETISEGGIQQSLKRVGGLWFFPDSSMYVYYTPKFWKEK